MNRVADHPGNDEGAAYVRYFDYCPFCSYENGYANIHNPDYCCDAFHTAVTNEYFRLDEGKNPNKFEFSLVTTEGIPAGVDFCPYCGRRVIVRNLEIVHM
jgi:hypothetical protein